MKPDWPRAAVFLAVVLGATFLFKSCMDHMAAAPRRAREEVTAAARDAAGWVRETFGLVPEVRVNETVLHGQSAPVAELAVVERSMPLTYEWAHTWMGSTKTVRVRGVWRAKAGFDLYKPFIVTIDPATRRVSADLPEAEILSVELESGPTLQGEGGLWNRISEEDRNIVLGEFRARARAHIEASTLKREAEEQAGARLQMLAERNEGRGGFEFRFRRPDAAAP